MRLNHNMASLNIYRAYCKNLKTQSKALLHISTGEKINQAKEAPNGIAKSERMRLQIRGLQMSQRNIQDGVSMMQTADGALDCMESIVHRIRELTVQYGNGANSEGDKQAIKNEIDQMIKGYDSIAKDTQFNGVNIFSEDKEREMQLGSKAGEKIKIPFKNLMSSQVGEKNGTKLSEIEGLLDDGKIDEVLSVVDASFKEVVNIRSKYGALTNKFESTMSNLGEFEIVTQKSESRIRDADIAEEMMEYAKCNILYQSGTAMMAQTNKFPQDVLRILENVRSR